MNFAEMSVAELAAYRRSRRNGEISVAQQMADRENDRLARDGRPPIALAQVDFGPANGSNFGQYNAQDAPDQDDAA